MTKQELNRDVKRLFNKVRKADILDDKIMSEIQKEFMRLYWADKEFENLTRDNILRMLVMNRKYNFKNHAFFTISINEDKL